MRPFKTDTLYSFSWRGSKTAIYQPLRMIKLNMTHLFSYINALWLICMSNFSWTFDYFTVPWATRIFISFESPNKCWFASLLLNKYFKVCYGLSKKSDSIKSSETIIQVDYWDYLCSLKTFKIWNSSDFFYYFEKCLEVPTLGDVLAVAPYVWGIWTS